MNSAVKEILGQADMSEQLIRVEKDDQNRISMLSMNTMAINEIANRCAIAAKDRIAQFTESSIKVPLGNVVGSKLFSGKGPKIRVKVQQAGTATAGFYTEFETAGINQTRYKIYVVLKARIRMICGSSLAGGGSFHRGAHFGSDYRGQCPRNLCKCGGFI